MSYDAPVTTAEIIGLIIALIVMLIGLVGCVLPGIPSTPVTLLGAVLHKLYFMETSVGWIVLTMLVGITLLSLVVDYLASVYGAKRFGATWRGMWGAILGGIIGLFFNLPGILFGPFLGAAAFEMVGGRDWKDASKAGLGATIGLLAGAVGKAVACVVMMILFTGAILYRAYFA